MNTVSVERLLEIGIALSKEKDNDKLFELILTAAMDITNCDGGTLYQKDGDRLVFQLMFTKSNNTRQGGRYAPIKLPAVPISRHNVCACAAIDGALININDVYASDRFDFSGAKKYDALIGYKTASMLVVPMENARGRCIGVLQLINALDAKGKITAFDASCEPVILSLASQTAICKEKMTYVAEIAELLDSLVRVMSTTIDALTPYNANHTRNMVKYGGAFLDWLEKTNNPWQFDAQLRRQFLMSVWLHDAGKITVPLEVMDKESRLAGGLERVLERFRIIALLDEIAHMNGRLDTNAYELRRGKLQSAREFIQRISTVDFLSDESLEQVNILAEQTYIDENNRTQPWLTEGEIAALSVRKGTLTDGERSIMESHVVMTDKMLREISFPEDYNRVNEWARSHHEFLDGTGYPMGLRGDEISPEVRLLTILDIFDALTARDRPYKLPMPVEKALGIMDTMVAEGKLDEGIFALFKESCAWEG